MADAVPIFEVKNKLTYFIHKAEKEGPIPISRRGKEVAYIVSKDDLDKLKESKPKEKNIVEEIHDSRVDFGLTDEDDFDYTEYFDSLRLRDYYGRPDSEHIFDGV